MQRQTVGVSILSTYVCVLTVSVGICVLKGDGEAADWLIRMKTARQTQPERKVKRGHDGQGDWSGHINNYVFICRSFRI